MKNRQRRLIRLIAIILAVLLAGSAVFSAIFSLAYGEEMPARNSCELTMEYMGNEQALRITQRLVYTNVSGMHLDRVVFYAPANLFRRQDALLYAVDDLSSLPYGYAPGGIDLQGVYVNGEAADWGYQGKDEIYLRAACDLDAGESCEFVFEYYLLLTANAAFMGVGESDWRLSDFYFTPAILDENYGEFMLSSPVSFTRWIFTPAMDFSASILLPGGCMLASTGEESSEEAPGGRLWRISAENVHDFSLCFRSDWREREDGELRCLTTLRGKDDDILKYAREAVACCEAWFGPFPAAQMDFAETGDAASFRSRSGNAWLSKDLIKAGGDELRRAVYFCIAQQYFGFSAYARPGADAWLSDSICEYISYLILEEAKGSAAYSKALNENIVPSLQLTIPGGLTVVSDASLFDAGEYSIVVKDRGAAVFHELRTAMGREEMIEGLRIFFQKGQPGSVLTEMDLVNSMNEASGGSWEAFITDWVYNIGDYVNQEISWLD